MTFAIGDRVRIIRKEFGHPDLAFLTGVEGNISLVEEPWKEDPKQRIRYEVVWPEPKGPRGYTGHFPLFETDLELLATAEEIVALRDALDAELLRAEVLMIEYTGCIRDTTVLGMRLKRLGVSIDSFKMSVRFEAVDTPTQLPEADLELCDR